jgi:hypothetical protein
VFGNASELRTTAASKWCMASAAATVASPLLATTGGCLHPQQSPDK